MVTLDKT